jgi:hypothetical protein
MENTPNHNNATNPNKVKSQFQIRLGNVGNLNANFLREYLSNLFGEG